MCKYNKPATTTNTKSLVSMCKSHGIFICQAVQLLYIGSPVLMHLPNCTQAGSTLASLPSWVVFAVRASSLLESIPTLKGNVPKYIKGIPPSLLDKPTQCRFLERCPLAVEKCKELPPKFKTETGYVRCWLYEDEK